jgi:hypothetical protein
VQCCARVECTAQGPHGLLPQTRRCAAARQCKPTKARRDAKATGEIQCCLASAPTPSPTPRRRQRRFRRRFLRFRRRCRAHSDLRCPVPRLCRRRRGLRLRPRRSRRRRRVALTPCTSTRARVRIANDECAPDGPNNAWVCGAKRTCATLGCTEANSLCGRLGPRLDAVHSEGKRLRHAVSVQRGVSPRSARSSVSLGLRAKAHFRHPVPPGRDAVGQQQQRQRQQLGTRAGTDAPDARRSRAVGHFGHCRRQPRRHHGLLLRDCRHHHFAQSRLGVGARGRQLGGGRRHVFVQRRRRHGGGPPTHGQGSSYPAMGGAYPSGMGGATTPAGSATYSTGTGTFTREELPAF